TGSGFRAGDRHLGRSTLLKRGAFTAPKPGSPNWPPALMHRKIGRNFGKSIKPAGLITQGRVRWNRAGFHQGKNDGGPAFRTVSKITRAGAKALGCTAHGF